MNRIVRASLVLVALLAFAAPERVAAQEPTVVVLVRHAEKAAAGGQDPELSEEGAARAVALAGALAGTKVDAVVTTQLRRTHLTAEPLLRERGLTPEVVPVAGGTEAHVKAVADAVRRHAGRTVLVVGHSNTIPAIATALGAPPMDEWCEHEYSYLLLMVLRPGERPSLLRTHFGPPNPAPTAPCPPASGGR